MHLDCQHKYNFVVVEQSMRNHRDNNFLHSAGDSVGHRSFPCYSDFLSLQLWDLLMPDTPLEKRITKQWGTIGFQGDDPATDFRGMGKLRGTIPRGQEGNHLGQSTAARSLVLSRLNYANVLFLGANASGISKFQRMEIRVTKLSNVPGNLTTLLLKQFHQLPVKEKIQFTYSSLFTNT